MVGRHTLEHIPDVRAFVTRIRAAVAASGARSVIWGPARKACHSSLLQAKHVAAAVDINPNKHGTFMAGTGHPVIAPGDLVEISPELVVVMNPVYLDEIGKALRLAGLSPRVVAV
ncbi:hypothetical protein BH23ACT4_BH23ACT4_02700 [soil metagenome]